MESVNNERKPEKVQLIKLVLLKQQMRESINKAVLVLVFQQEAESTSSLQIGEKFYLEGQIKERLRFSSHVLHIPSCVTITEVNQTMSFPTDLGLCPLFMQERMTTSTSLQNKDLVDLQKRSTALLS